VYPTLRKAPFDFAQGRLRVGQPGCGAPLGRTAGGGCPCMTGAPRGPNQRKQPRAIDPTAGTRNNS